MSFSFLFTSSLKNILTNNNTYIHTYIYIYILKQMKEDHSSPRGERKGHTQAATFSPTAPGRRPPAAAPDVTEWLLTMGRRKDARRKHAHF